jgi:hypothetical protein
MAKWARVGPLSGARGDLHFLSLGDTTMKPWQEWKFLVRRERMIQSGRIPSDGEMWFFFAGFAIWLTLIALVAEGVL